jgi:precorrin-8X/cobalt-precorrin-8 methylmutase
MKQLQPKEIEDKSFGIIEKRIPKGVYSAEELEIVKKVIHTTADFSLRKNVHISPDAISLAMKNLKQGADIFADVMMVAAGISPPHLKNYKGKVLCYIRNKAVEELAKKEKITRSQAAVRLALKKNKNIGIFAIGNAPTALFEILKAAKEGLIKNTVVIGACVGMVGAAQSKALLIKSGVPCIAIKGKRGGSPIAATIVNALFKLIKVKR